MRKSLPVLITIFLFVFSSTSYAESTDKLTFDHNGESSAISNTLLNQENSSLHHSDDSLSPANSMHLSVLMKADIGENERGRDSRDESTANPENNNDSSMVASDLADVTSKSGLDYGYDPIDWDYYLSITGPDEAPYMLLYYNDELDEVEYLYPTLTLEEFIEEADPIVYSVFNASWRGQEEELQELLEDLAQRYDFVLFVMVDADSLPADSLSRYLVRELPLFLIFEEGKVMSQVEGYHASFSSAIEQSLIDILES